MNKRNKLAFPAKVNAMGFESGLTKRELASILILNGLLAKESIDELSYTSALELSIEITDKLLLRLEQTSEQK